MMADSFLHLFGKSIFSKFAAVFVFYKSEVYVILESIVEYFIKDQKHRIRLKDLIIS